MMEQCDYPMCPNVFHLKCASLESVPTGAWHCPVHRCVLCSAVDGGGLSRLWMPSVGWMTVAVF